MRATIHKCSAAILAGSLLASSAAAAPRTVDPLLALSILGTSESRAALCAAGAAQVAAPVGGAVSVQGGADPRGCVLPVLDAAPAPAVGEAPTVPAIAGPPSVVGASSLLPLLAGLAAVAVAAAIMLKDGDADINLPSPEGVPISP